MVDITIQDVEEVYGQQETSMDQPRKVTLTGIAERLTEDVFGGRVSRLSEIEGDESDFAAYLAAHLWEIAERKALNNEFQTGFSEDVEAIRSDPNSALSGSIYGEVCLLMLRDRASIGIVRADY